MRLPQPLVESPFFAASDVDEVVTALGSSAAVGEREELERLHALGLPPVTSVNALSVMLGLNSGLIWSFINRPSRHYRTFNLPKGKGQRVISAPRVGLKIVQTWIAHHLSRSIRLPPHVFGFVPGRSHVDAAFEHRGADWAYSVDVSDFFVSTPQALVAERLTAIGFSPASAQIVSALSCLNQRLTQGSPASPVLSNISFLLVDEQLDAIARSYDCKLTRYADDIVFSGSGYLPDGLVDAVQSQFAGRPWSLAQHKSRIEPIKGRIKVHGLIVNGPSVRLTKGYRNKLRAYKHVLATRDNVQNANSLRGHLNYAEHVSSRLKLLEEYPPERQNFDYLRNPRVNLIDDADKLGATSVLRRMIDRIKVIFLPQN